MTRRSETDLEPLRLGIDHLSSLDASILRPGGSYRLDVSTDHAVVPLLVAVKEAADHLLIMNNGAVDHGRAQGRPVFQRSSWSVDIDHHVMYVCDPTTVGDERVSLGWGQVSDTYDVSADIALIAQNVATGLGLSASSDRTYFGSSAGGYLSLAALAHDPGASAIVNNAQFDWTRWFPPAVNRLRDLRFPTLTPQYLREILPHRTNCLKALAAAGFPLDVTYLVNLASKHDATIDYPMFHEFLTTNPQLCEHVTIKAYFDEEKLHNPLDRDETLSLLNTHPSHRQRRHIGRRTPMTWYVPTPQKNSHERSAEGALTVTSDGSRSVYIMHERDDIEFKQRPLHSPESLVTGRSVRIDVPFDITDGAVVLQLLVLEYGADASSGPRLVWSQPAEMTMFYRRPRDTTHVTLAVRAQGAGSFTIHDPIIRPWTEASRLSRLFDVRGRRSVRLSLHAAARHDATDAALMTIQFSNSDDSVLPAIEGIPSDPRLGNYVFLVADTTSAGALNVIDLDVPAGAVSMRTEGHQSKPTSPVFVDDELALTTPAGP